MSDAFSVEMTENLDGYVCVCVYLVSEEETPAKSVQGWGDPYKAKVWGGVCCLTGRHVTL